jgi:HPt (histidine-containing phosphotransfer) domain-containing protein
MVQSTAATKQTNVDGKQRSHRPIDLVHLAKQTLGDHGLECEVLRLFDTMVQRYFARVELSTNIDELRVHLHSLKGAATGVGAWSIADRAKLIEDELNTGLLLNPERIDDLHMAVQEASEFIATILAIEPDEELH